VLLLTASGAPLVYYGDEIGMEGEDDPDCRRCMEWDEAKHDRELLRTHRALIALRRAKPWLAWGSFEDLVVDDAREVYAYRRRARGPLERQYGGSDEMVYVALNTAATAGEVRLPARGGLLDVVSGERIGVADGDTRVPLGPDDARVLLPARS